MFIVSEKNAKMLFTVETTCPVTTTSNVKSPIGYSESLVNVMLIL